jgi:hypothetical protein
MKRYDCGDEVKAASFWPQDDVRAAYAAVETETKDGGELYALRRFHRRMCYFLNTAMKDVDMNLDTEAVDYAYEAPALEKDLAAIRCGASPADEAAPQTFTPIIKQFDDGIAHEGGINSINFYPAERVEEIFDRMKSAMNTPGEAAELKIFYLRIARLYDEAEYSRSWVGIDEFFHAYAKQEARENAEFLRKITGGA